MTEIDQSLILNCQSCGAWFREDDPAVVSEPDFDEKDRFEVKHFCPNCLQSELKDAYEWGIRTPWQEARAEEINAEIDDLEKRIDELKDELKNFGD